MSILLRKTCTSIPMVIGTDCQSGYMTDKTLHVAFGLIVRIKNYNNFHGNTVKSYQSLKYCIILNKFYHPSVIMCAKHEHMKLQS